MDAYWLGASNIPWGQIGSSLSVAFGAASPVLLLILRGRQKRQDYREKVAETASERVDRIAREEYANIVVDRDRYRALLQAEEIAHTETKRDRDDGWNAGRGMEQWAHDQRHIYAGVLQNARCLWIYLEKVAKGQTAVDAIMIMLSQAEVLPDKLGKVPKLRDVQRMRAKDCKS